MNETPPPPPPTSQPEPIKSANRPKPQILNAELTGKHFAALGAIGLILLVGYKVVQSRKAEAELLQRQITIHAKMPTPDEAVKWAVWDAKTKYYSFDIMSTNVAQTVETHTFSGIKRGGAAEVAEEKQMFGAAYDAYSKGDSFTRQETNFACDLVITHAKPKPDSEVSMLVTSEMLGDTPDTNHLHVDIHLNLEIKYASYDVLKSEVYRANRTVWGRMMKPVNTESGIAYEWDTENRDKNRIESAWVMIEEVGNLKPK